MFHELSPMSSIVCGHSGSLSLFERRAHITQGIKKIKLLSGVAKTSICYTIHYVLYRDAHILRSIHLMIGHNHKPSCFQIDLPISMRQKQLYIQLFVCCSFLFYYLKYVLYYYYHYCCHKRMFFFVIGYYALYLFIRLFMKFLIN